MVYDVNLALPCVPMIIEEPRAGKSHVQELVLQCWDSAGTPAGLGRWPFKA